LINNAGAMFSSRRLTEDGLEYTFALNHMAYFVVTDGPRERLLASSPARIVNSASAAHQGARLDFDDLQLAKSFGPMKAYGRSKLCNISCKARGSPPIACIPASSPRASATKAAA
jgi:NAD(P)-dependent dehydrogenase (short-subunit alcohol dehydrogenase family)